LFVGTTNRTEQCTICAIARDGENLSDRWIPYCTPVYILGLQNISENI